VLVYRSGNRLTLPVLCPVPDVENFNGGVLNAVSQLNRPCLGCFCDLKALLMGLGEFGSKAQRLFPEHLCGPRASSQQKDDGQSFLSIRR